MKDGTAKTGIKKPSISVDRASKSWAIFEDDRHLFHGFIPYTDEAAAIADARAFVATRSSVKPTIVYPFVSKFSAYY